MATDAQQAAESGEEQKLDNQADQADAPENQQEESNGADHPWAEAAREMGWRPKDEFDGDPEKWRPADEFVRATRDINYNYRNEIKSLNNKIDTIARTSASIVEQRVQERVAELAQAHQKAVDDGEPEKAFKIASEITTLTQRGQAPQPSPDARSFAEKHQSWFQKDPLATSLAIETTNKLAAQGYDEATQLRYAEQEVRRQYPHLFGKANGGKPPAGVNPPSSRSTGPSNRKQGFSDLPPEAQKIARDMADRKVISSVDDYAKNYFANMKAKG